MTPSQVKRALQMWKDTGNKVVGPRPGSDFSKGNWGDRIDIQENTTISRPSTSNLVKVINKLSDKQWEKILAAAWELVVSVKVEAAPPAAIVDDNLGDFELLDDDDDI